MKVSTSVLALLIGAVAAAPASAQFGYKSGSAKKDQPKQEQPAATTADGQVRPSAQAIKAIVALQTAVNSRDAAAIKAAAQAAQAVATTKEDRYLIGQLQLNAAVAANDDAAAAAAVDAIAASSYLDGPRLAQLYATLGKKALQGKQYALADSLITKAVALQPNSADLLLVQGDARLAAGKKAEALASYQQVIQARTAAGQKPEEELYKRAVQAAYDARLPSAGDLALQWVTAYPNAESWRNSIAIYRNSAKPDLEGTVDLLRLMRAAGTLNRAADLNLYVNALVEQSNFIEAQNAVDQALKAPGADAAEVQKLLAMLESKPKVTAADLAAAAKSAQSGMGLLRIGDRYYGLGEYAKAAETYGAAKAKGADSNLVTLRTGIALAAAGNKAGASTAFNAVTGPRAGIAKYWLLYLQTKG
jgi:tetratricopeptide (TPR) repeat protein